MCVYIYKYRERERDRGRGRLREGEGELALKEMSTVNSRAKDLDFRGLYPSRCFISRGGIPGSRDA